MDFHKVEGNFDFDKKNLNVAIVVSRFNDFVTSKLRDGAIDTLKRHGLYENQITVAYCPGSYEIPLTAQKVLETGNFDGIIALGAVIQGATPHFDYVCNAVNRGISELNLKYDKPVIFGVITTNTIEQALERAGTKMGNKGSDAAMSLLEMISLIKNIGK